MLNKCQCPFLGHVIHLFRVELRPEACFLVLLCVCVHAAEQCNVCLHEVTRFTTLCNSFRLYDSPSTYLDDIVQSVQQNGKAGRQG